MSRLRSEEPGLNPAGRIPRDHATLCFVVQANRLLLIRKKRGLGAGKINGVGGKCEPGETAAACIHREAREELHIELRDPEPRAELYFQFTDGYSLFCTVFVATRFAGIPTATSEADPFWCELSEIPFPEMWEDDYLWLPRVLAGERVRGYFLFQGDKMLRHDVTFLP